MSESIRVVVRIRPINSKELSLNCQSIVTAHEDNNQISILKPDEPEQVKTFAYDSVFSDTSLQSNVYAKTAYALVQNVLQGYNGTIFAYGQTGCGKTHSMVGKLDVEELKGIIPRSFGHILNTISETKNRQFLIRCSFIEIYNEEVRDLLGKDVKKSLEIKQSPDKGVFIKDLSSNPAKTHDELMDYMNLGNRNRSVGETAMNKDSSRSHLLFMLYLESADLSVPEENRKYIGSKLNLVDLAGSERINKTGAQGERLQEAKSINLSLSALGNVISALVDGKSHHIPYRDSKLTRLLQDSLGGNTKTVMIANCSPADYNFDETISTLRYASRAKFIKNKPIINEDPKDALLKEYSNEIKKLKEILSKQGGCADFSDLSAGSSGELGEKMKEKEMELANEKQETRMLQERLKALEKQHLLGENVKVDKTIKQNLQVVRKCSIIQIPAQSRIPGPDDSKGMKFTTFPSQIQLQSNQQNHKQVIKTLKSQIKNLEGEIEDVQHENYLDKELILGDIRNLSKENKLLEGIINFLLSPKELEIIKERIERVEKEQHQKPNPEGIVYGYNQDKNQYVVPKFTTREKDIILPKLAQNQEDGLEIKSNKVTEKNINNRRSVLEDKSYKLVNEDKYAIKSNHKPGDDVPALEIKNTSFVSGKPKENSGQGIDKKNMGKIRPLIQEAREANESLFYESSSPKKNLPSHLQPLGKPEMQEKLQRMLQNEKEKENKGLERPKKLEKLNFPSGKVSPAKRD